MRPLPQAAWNALIECGFPRRFASGDTLLRQGDRGTGVLVLIRGQVKVVRVEPDGSELLLAVRGAQDLLGELAVLDGEERSATVSALTSCLAYAVTAERFHRVVHEFELHGLLIRRAIRSLREGEGIRAELAGLSAVMRVARTLLRLAVGLEVPLTQSEVAAATGLSRSAVAGELAALRRSHIITTARRRMVIRDLDALRALAWHERPVLDTRPEG
ncbi:Crp/Fnr family transcriptional regulator [Nonomuraea muscovyensis]|uniref:Crp/Fnr family transcriptional regulator n=1 Tax=Nonomuraea muscovyensis TaxID=1124761 RepID=UPI00160B1005|nr:Crp/Fnr family transcriptional regulator [Nonomuraea muscovyensis]